MLARLRQRPEWKFFAVLPRADPGLAVLWWVLLILNGVLPAIFSIAIGVLIGAVQGGASNPALPEPVEGPLAFAGIVFVLMQVLPPIHQAVSMNLTTAVFQDFIRFELSLRENVAPQGASDASILAALQAAGADHLASLDTPLSKGYADGTDLSGGQWQRVALARALCAVREGAGLVLLDEPTAQLDVRGEAAIFDRVLAATRSATTILISHRPPHN